MRIPCLVTAVVAPARAGTLSYQFIPDAGPSAPGAIVIFPAPPASADEPWSIPATPTDDPQGISGLFYNLQTIAPGIPGLFQGPAADVNVSPVSPAGGVPDAGTVFWDAIPAGLPIVVIGVTFGPDATGTLVAAYEAGGTTHGFEETGTWVFSTFAPEPPGAVLLGLGILGVLGSRHMAKR